MGPSNHSHAHSTSSLALKTFASSKKTVPSGLQLPEQGGALVTLGKETEQGGALVTVGKGSVNGLWHLAWSWSHMRSGGEDG